MRKTLFLLMLFITCISAMGASFCFAANSYQWPVSGDVLVGYKADGHRGLDIASTIGNEIVSAQDGIVVWIGKTPRGEGCIAIEHSDGMSSTYLPVEASIKKGETVAAGDRIGSLSSAGDPSCAATHLHFGVYNTSTRSDKEYLDPRTVLPATSGLLPTDNSPAETANSNCTVGSNQVFNNIGSDSVQGGGSEQLVTKPANENSSDIKDSVPQDTKAGNQSTVVDSYQGNLRQSDLSNVASSGLWESVDTTIETVKGTSVIQNKTFQTNFFADNVGVKQINSVNSQGVPAVLDSTYHEVQNVALKNKKNTIVKPPRIKSNASSMAGYDRFKGDHTAVTIQSFANAMSNRLAWKQLTSEQKEKLIKAVNPFVGNDIHAGQAVDMVAGARDALTSSEVSKTPTREQLAILNFIGRILEAESMPDVMAIMALAWIIILSVGGFYKNMHTMKKILPTSSIVSC